MSKAKTTRCARKGCPNTFEQFTEGRRKGQRYCSPACRFKAWHDRTYIKRTEAQVGN